MRREAYPGEAYGYDELLYENDPREARHRHDADPRDVLRALLDSPPAPIPIGPTQWVVEAVLAAKGRAWRQKYGHYGRGQEYPRRLNLFRPNRAWP